MRQTILAAVFIFITQGLLAQKGHALRSPDNRLKFEINTKKGTIFYRVFYKNSLLISSSSLGLVFADVDFQKNLSISKPMFSKGIESYELLVGKSKKVNHPFTEMVVPIQQSTGAQRKLNLVVRAFNDGIAFRYVFLEGVKKDSFILKDEASTFRLVGNPDALTLFLPNYTSSHEGVYSNLPYDQIENGRLMDMPALFTFPNHIYMAITEAALTNHAGMYLTKKGDALTSMLSPLPSAPGAKVKSTLPHKTPWRVMLISDTLGHLIESNLITSLNEPTEMTELGWLKPGKTTFPWWNGNVMPDTINAPGNNFVSAKYYIDFCARNDIEYHSVVEYGGHAWYVDDGINFQPGPGADVTKPVPGLDMKEICDYAANKGVGVRVWVHWAALYPKLDSAFALFERWGIQGMMVDFMDRDDQEMVNIQTEMLQKAAKHRMHIQFHGAYKPTGLHLTYPNEFTREGTRNYEVNKWESKGLSPGDDLNIVFTRMLAGSADYHLGGFRAVRPDSFRAQYTKPLMLGTRCHSLALYVVLENYLQMVCDYPEAYEGAAGFEFLKEVPTSWDETKVLDAKVGSHVIIARRKGKDWYVGAIAGNEPKTLQISFAFLGTGRFTAEIYTDDNSNDLNGLDKRSVKVSASDAVALTLKDGGGAVMRILAE